MMLCRAHGLPKQALQCQRRGRSQRAVGGRPNLKCSAVADALPGDFGYVLASVAFSAGLVQWQAVRVSLARRTYSVAYPAMYAEGGGAQACTFNCVQRAHQNTLETLAPLLAMEVLLGLQHPLAAAAAGMAWNLGRIVYTLGYSTGDPNARLPGVVISGLTYYALVAATLGAGLQQAGVLPAISLPF